MYFEIMTVDLEARPILNYRQLTFIHPPELILIPATATESSTFTGRLKESVCVTIHIVLGKYIESLDRIDERK
jgi:hypothetical protein